MMLATLLSPLSRISVIAMESVRFYSAEDSCHLFSRPHLFELRIMSITELSGSILSEPGTKCWFHVYPMRNDVK